MSIKLDLKQFKHVSSDGQSTTLQHKDGHQLTIAHRPLSKESRSQLEALAQLSKDAGKSIDKGQQRHEAQMAMAEGGKVKKGSATISAKNAEEGTKAANKMRRDEDLNDGATIIIEGKDVGSNYGKVKGPDGKKPKVFAEGGEVDDSAAPVANAEEMLKFDPTKVPEAPHVDPALARKREIYNNMQAAERPMGESFKTGPMDDTGQFFGGQQDDGPKDLDPNKWSQAETAYSQEQSQNADKAAANQQMVIKQNLARTQAGLAPLPVPNVPQGPQIPGSPGNEPAPKADQLPGLNGQGGSNLGVQPPQYGGGLGVGGGGNPEGMMQQGFNQRVQGINQQAAAQAALGQEQSKLLEDRARAQQDAQVAYKQSYDSLEKERQMHMEDIRNAHIDPNKYWTGDKDGNGSHSKVASAIGMILAGFNPTSQPNAAINFLKTQMDANLKAQEQNLGSEQNLLAANMRQFGNLKDATDMTRLMQNDIVQSQLQAAAAKAASPMAKAAALQAAGQLQMESAPMFQQFAMRRAMMNMAGGSSGNPSDTRAAEQMIAYARVSNPEMAKEMEARLIPGVGMAKVPVPHEARQEMIAKESLNKAATDLYDYSKKHTNLVPGTPEYNFGVTKALAFQQKVREGLLGTVFRESEKSLLEKFVKENPAGAFKSFTTQPQLRAIMESNRSGLNSLKAGYGLPTQEAPQSQEPVRGKDGNMYVRQGNLMVPFNIAKGK